jgi:RNA recognition motif-containing protein
MSTEAYDDSESPAESEESPAETNGGEVKLYIGNLSWDMDEQSLQDLFAQYEATDCVIVTDRNTGRSRGFGFATVPSQEMADSAIAALNESEQFWERNESRRFFTAGRKTAERIQTEKKLGRGWEKGVLW